MRKEVREGRREGKGEGREGGRLADKTILKGHMVLTNCHGCPVLYCLSRHKCCHGCKDEWVSTPGQQY